MREAVADHYRSKGYTIREQVKVRGQSGTVHAIDMVAQGPLGNLVISFEDDLEGPEVTAARRAARDIGATPVIASRRIPDTLRRRAAQAGVVVLDEEALQRTPPREPEPEEPEQAPWPDPERRAAAGKSTDPGFWRLPRGGRPQEFAWLPRQDAPPEAASIPPLPGPALEARPSSLPAQAPLRPPALPPRQAAVVRMPWWQWVVLAGVFGVASGGAFYAFLRIFG